MHVLCFRGVKKARCYVVCFRGVKRELGEWIILHDSFTTESPVLVLQSLRHVPMIQCHERLHTYMNIREYKIYKQNRALLNAGKGAKWLWFCNTILEQLVDEIIVISDALFIDSSVSWWSFWTHLMDGNKRLANYHRNNPIHCCVESVTCIDSTYWEICETKK